MTTFYHYVYNYNPYVVPPARVWKNDSSESDEALDRLKRYGYRPDRIYKVRGVRDHYTEELYDPRPSRRVINGCTLAPFITMIKVEALRTGHRFSELFKWRVGPGLKLENALRDIVRMFSDGGPDGHPNIDKAAKVRWAELVNEKQPMRIPEVNAGEFDASGEEGGVVIDSLDPVSQFFITWRCGGCVGPDKNGVQAAGHRIRAESRTCFTIGSIDDYTDIEDGIIRHSTFGPHGVCKDCNQGFSLDAIHFPDTTWMLIFEGLAYPHCFKGDQQKMEYRMKLGGVSWKKAYVSFGFDPGAEEVDPVTRIPTGSYTQSGNFGHGLSIQYIKGTAYLQNDGGNDGELIPWPYSKPPYEPIFCARIVYIRAPPVPEKTCANYNPMVNERMPTHYISMPSFLPYVFPPQPHITYRTPTCPNLISTPAPAYYTFLPSCPVYPRLPQQPQRPQPFQPQSMPGGVTRFGNPGLYYGPNSMRYPYP